MSSIQNTNRNNISIKTDSAAQLVRELSKLGVFRKKGKKRAKQAPSNDGIRQDNEMVGYVRSLGGPQMRNLPPIQQITAGMTQNQIENIQRTNDAAIAALRAEVEQHRNESQQTIGGLAGAAAERFSKIQNVLGTIVNPATERFRGSMFPAQSSGDQPIDPFASSRRGVIYLGNEPDVTEERFTETLNEGGPEAEEEQQQGLYPGEDEEQVGIDSSVFVEDVPSAMGGGGSRIQPQQKIVKTGPALRQQVKDKLIEDLGIGPVPIQKKTKISPMRDYYVGLIQRLGLTPEIDPFKSDTGEIWREITRIVEKEVDRRLGQSN
jgi:hypothetical protein